MPKKDLAKRKEYSKSYYINNKDKWVNAYAGEDGKQRRRDLANKRYRTDPRTVLLAKARARAKQLGVTFNLSREDIPIPTNCPVLGIPIFIGNGNATDNSPTLDRLLPDVGYVKGNVFVISYRANRIKNDASLSEIEAIFTYMKKYLWG